MRRAFRPSPVFTPAAARAEYAGTVRCTGGCSQSWSRPGGALVLAELAALGGSYLILSGAITAPIASCRRACRRCAAAAGVPQAERLKLDVLDAARLFDLFDDPEAQATYRDLFIVRSRFVHGDAMAVIPGMQGRARGLWRAIAAPVGAVHLGEANQRFE